MNKMQMAHDWAMKRLEDPEYVVPMDAFAAEAWRYADAMQAEAEKRKTSGLPESLYPKLAWHVAPSWAKYWAIRDGSQALWCASKPACTDDCLMSNGACSPAPSFGFTGSHIVERPQ